MMADKASSKFVSEAIFNIASASQKIVTGQPNIYYETAEHNPSVLVTEAHHLEYKTDKSCLYLLPLRSEQNLF